MNEVNESVLNLDFIKSNKNKEKKSEALMKISKRPPVDLTQKNISNPNKKKIEYKQTINPTKILFRNFLNNPVLLNKTETEKKLEKKISSLLNANTNNSINNKANKINLKSNNSNDFQGSRNNKNIKTSIGNYLNNKLDKLNLNNPNIMKHSFDLSIPNNSTMNSTKSKTSSNKISRSINSTPVNSFNVKNVNFFNLKFNYLEEIIQHISY